MVTSRRRPTRKLAKLAGWFPVVTPRSLAHRRQRRRRHALHPLAISYILRPASMPSQYLQASRRAPLPHGCASTAVPAAVETNADKRHSPFRHMILQQRVRIRTHAHTPSHNGRRWPRTASHRSHISCQRSATRSSNLPVSDSEPTQTNCFRSFRIPPSRPT